MAQGGHSQGPACHPAIKSTKRSSSRRASLISLNRLESGTLVHDTLIPFNTGKGYFIPDE
jgi:hypothetical protein